jgi:hypothetical protein
VVKIEGKHRGVKSNREWLPFVVRLYFYAGQESVRLVHTVVYDGDESRDFIRGLGVAFSVPMREEVHNRHVRFSGEGLGLWSEPIQPMIGRGGRFVAHPQTGADVYPDQVAGRRVPNKKDYNASGSACWTIGRCGTTSSWSNQTPTGLQCSSALTLKARGYRPDQAGALQAWSSRAT